jgi:hypothetical protein
MKLEMYKLLSLENVGGCRYLKDIDLNGKKSVQFILEKQVEI